MLSCDLRTTVKTAAQPTLVAWSPATTQPVTIATACGLSTCDIHVNACPPRLFVQMVERGSALLRKMEISVAEAEKRTGKNTVNMQETYTVYLIEIRLV